MHHTNERITVILTSSQSIAAILTSKQSHVNMSNTSSKNNSHSDSPSHDSVDVFFSSQDEEVPPLPRLPAAAHVTGISTVWDHPFISIIEDITPTGHLKKSWKCLAPGRPWLMDIEILSIVTASMSSPAVEPQLRNRVICLLVF
jgi:hypothetical protein